MCLAETTIINHSIKSSQKLASKLLDLSLKSLLNKNYNGLHCHHGVLGARCSSVVRAFTHGAMGRRIDPSWVRPIELFLVPASAPQLV